MANADICPCEVQLSTVTACVGPQVALGLASLKGNDIFRIANYICITFS